MNEKEPKQLEASPTIDLAARKHDGMEIILWHVKSTLDTYVTVDDSREGRYLVVPVPEGVSPMEVYNHPFRFPEIQPPLAEAA